MRVKDLSRTVIGLGVVLLFSTAPFPGRVAAKGIDSATIDGPGLVQPIELGQGRGATLTELADYVAMWAVTPGYPEPALLAERAPTTRLGPSYTLTWHLPSGPDATTPIVQELYPEAEGGPLVYTGARQELYDDVTAGGWYRAGAELGALLLSLGVPSPAALDRTGDAASCDGAGWPSVSG